MADVEASPDATRVRSAAAVPAARPSSVVMVLESVFPPTAGGGSEGQVMTLGRHLIGQGIPLFRGAQRRASLTLAESRALGSGVVCLHHTRPR